MPTSSLPPIKGFLENSFVDWPGMVAAVLFLPRCNFRCPYCHNHRLVLSPEDYETWSIDGVLAELDRYRAWIDGVCITGGEPTMHPGLGRLVELLSDQGWRVKLDTNGSRPDVVADLCRRGLLSAVSVDVKAPLEAIPYRRNAGDGADPAPVRRTLHRLAGLDLTVELRTTVHPALLSREEVERMGRDLACIFDERLSRHDGGGVTWKLQRCRVEEVLDASLRDLPPLDEQAFEAWVAGGRRRFSLGHGHSVRGEVTGSLTAGGGASQS